jgi:hypothetical protein
LGISKAESKVQVISSLMPKISARKPAEAHPAASEVVVDMILKEGLR